MKKKEVQSQNTSKKIFIKPSICEVKLRPEEAVLGNCKVGTSGTGGPAQSACSANVQCTGLGS